MNETRHFTNVLNERGIERAWAEGAIREPDYTEEHEDGTRHFIKRIPEFGDRWLRVVVNVSACPATKVTAFFDRRFRKLP